MQRFMLKVVVLVLALTVAVGAVWEIGESLLERAGMYLQPGLRDTMTDLIADGIGGTLAAFWGLTSEQAARRSVSSQRERERSGSESLPARGRVEDGL